MKKHRGNASMRTLLGLALIVFAVLLFFKNIGIHFSGMLLGNWPIALIVIGGVLLYSGKKSDDENKQTEFLPYFLIGIGVLFLLSKYSIISLSIGALIGPLVLLFIGVNILRPHKKRSQKYHNETKDEQATDVDVLDGEWEPMDDGSIKSAAPASNGEDTQIDVFTILGGGNFSTRSKALSGGNVIALLGGVDIDIREADANQPTIEIEVLAVMGGVEIKVPPHWDVVVKVLPLLGGVSNKTTCLAEKLSIPKKRVVVTGVAFMGGVEIRN